MAHDCRLITQFPQQQAVPVNVNRDYLQFNDRDTNIPLSPRGKFFSELVSGESTTASTVPTSTQITGGGIPIVPPAIVDFASPSPKLPDYPSNALNYRAGIYFVEFNDRGTVKRLTNPTLVLETPQLQGVIVPTGRIKRQSRVQKPIGASDDIYFPIERTIVPTQPSEWNSAEITGNVQQTVSTGNVTDESYYFNRFIQIIISRKIGPLSDKDINSIAQLIGVDTTITTRRGKTDAILEMAAIARNNPEVLRVLAHKIGVDFSQISKVFPQLREQGDVNAVGLLASENVGLLGQQSGLGGIPSSGEGENLFTQLSGGDDYD